VRDLGADVKSIAEAFGQAATHAPQPMHAAASIAGRRPFGMGIALPSGADPVLTEMKPPACDDAVERERSTTRSRITGKAARATARW
jgi:hypothetical protein